MNIAIYGYGNLGRGVECAAHFAEDATLIGVFTRRDPSSVKTASDVPVYSAEDILSFQDQIDVLILCGGSALEEMPSSIQQNLGTRANKHKVTYTYT